MHTATFFNVIKPETIAIQFLVDHVLARAEQLNQPIHNFNENAIVDWVSENFSNELWESQGMSFLGADLTQRGCMFVCNTLPDELMTLVQLDVMSLFHGREEIQSMVSTLSVEGTTHPPVNTQTVTLINGRMNPGVDTEGQGFRGPSFTDVVSVVDIHRVKLLLWFKGDLSPADQGFTDSTLPFGELIWKGDLIEFDGKYYGGVKVESV